MLAMEVANSTFRGISFGSDWATFKTQLIPRSAPCCRATTDLCAAKAIADTFGKQLC